MPFFWSRARGRARSAFSIERPGSEPLEVLLMHPVSDMGEKPSDLEVLDPQDVVDENIAERRTEESVLSQDSQRLHEALRQQAGASFIWLKRWLPRVQALPKSIDARS